MLPAKMFHCFLRQSVCQEFSSFPFWWHRHLQTSTIMALLVLYLGVVKQIGNSIGYVRRIKASFPQHSHTPNPVLDLVLRLKKTQQSF